MKPYEMLVKLNACPEAVAWVKKFRSAKSAWKACERGDWMLWYCGKKAGPVGDERRKLLVLAAVACARLALPIWKKRYPDDNRVEVCLDTAEKWARNEATLEALQVARRNCYAAPAADAAAYASLRRRRRRLRLRLRRRRRRRRLRLLRRLRRRAAADATPPPPPTPPPERLRSSNARTSCASTTRNRRYDPLRHKLPARKLRRCVQLA